jgi:hypothetical protein
MRLNVNITAVAPAIEITMNRRRLAKNCAIFSFPSLGLTNLITLTGRFIACNPVGEPIFPTHLNRGKAIYSKSSLAPYF